MKENLKVTDEKTIRDLAEKRGYGANVDAFVAGYLKDRTSIALDYPGPDRMAYQAGWVAEQVARDPLIIAARENGIDTEKLEQETVEVAISWKFSVEVFIAVLQNPDASPEAIFTAQEELRRLAKIGDKAVADAQ